MGSAPDQRKDRAHRQSPWRRVTGYKVLQPSELFWQFCKLKLGTQPYSWQIISVFQVSAFRVVLWYRARPLYLSDNRLKLCHGTATAEAGPLLGFRSQDREDVTCSSTRPLFRTLVATALGGLGYGDDSMGGRLAREFIASRNPMAPWVLAKEWSTPQRRLRNRGLADR